MELPRPPAHLRGRVVRRGSGEPGAAPEIAPVQGFRGHRLMQGGDGEPRVVDRTAWRPEPMQGVDDRVEHPAARVVPARRVQCHRELAVAVPVQAMQCLDEFEQVGATVQPAREELPKRVSEAAATVPEEFGEEFLAVAEVMGDAGVGHADARGHGPHLDGGDTGLAEQ